MDDILDFDIVEVSEEEFNLRLPNYGKVQQENITGQDQLKEGIVLCGRLIEVVHGEDAGKPCTLAVFEWYIHARTPKKRFRFVQIGISFASSRDNPRYNPCVIECAPHGAYSLVETTKKVEKKKGWEPAVELGIHGAATVKSGFVYDLVETVDRAEHIYVNGIPVLDGMNMDPDRQNAVEWNLFEAEGQQSGIPRYFRTAVLLERRPGDMERFTAKVSIKAKIAALDDAKRKVKSFLGQIPRDDPVIFDPTKPPTTQQFDTKLKSLGSVPLEDQCVFLLFKEFPKKPNPSQGTDDKQTDTEKVEGA